jgi:hypothetical protein
MSTLQAAWKAPRVNRAARFRRYLYIRYCEGFAVIDDDLAVPRAKNRRIVTRAASALVMHVGVASFQLGWRTS